MKMEFFKSSVFLAGCVLSFAYDDLSKDKIATQSTTFPIPQNDADRYKADNAVDGDITTCMRCRFCIRLDDLSNRRYATQSSTFPAREYAMYKAGNAVDGNITTCMRTEEIGRYSPDQTVWWRVDLGGVYNIYSVNILFKNYDGYEIRQRGRFAGFSLLVSDTATMENSSLCYKDGPHLPPLNFTTACITTGRFVTFYNERLIRVIYPDGYANRSVYTELCEVIVQGCQASGVYGNNCTEQCPTNCRDNMCHIKKGTCFGCVSGWMATTCDTKCTAGRYGVDCKQQCSGHCKDRDVCNHVTGGCDGSCAAGWKGVLCDQECENGTYGNNCVHNCSGNCLNDSPCNRQNGHCDMGCKPGYTNFLCNEHCPSKYYGSKCEKDCSEHCLINSVCDHIDGTCSLGCQPGYIGNMCNTSCAEGYYGHNCSSICSSNCKTCKPTDGTCICFEGWRGPNCSIESRGKYISSVSTTSSLIPAAIGGTLAICVLLIVSAVFILMRGKRLCMSSSKGSLYAEIEIRQSGESTYQQLNASGLGTNNTNQHQNISEPGSTNQQQNVAELELTSTYQHLNTSELEPDNTYQQLNVRGLVLDNTYQNLSLQ